MMKENGRRLEQLLRSHPGVVMDIGGTGEREACTRLRTNFRTDLPDIFCQRNEGACAPAALVHGIQVLRGQEVAEACRKCFQELQPSVQNLAKLNRC